MSGRDLPRPIVLGFSTTERTDRTEQTEQTEKKLGPWHSRATNSRIIGSLRGLALETLLQRLERGERSARVEVLLTDGRRGSVDLVDGDIRYAEVGGLLGAAALFELGTLEDGLFSLHILDGTSPPSLEPATARHGLATAPEDTDRSPIYGCVSEPVTQPDTAVLQIGEPTHVVRPAGATTFEEMLCSTETEVPGSTSAEA
jgi:hypothetical protein